MASTPVLAVGTSPTSLVELPTPTAITWGLQDVSASDSGRTHDANATMHKNRITQKRKLQLSWTNSDGADTATVLQAFQPEYVYVRYIDALTNSYEVRQFYSGDKSAPVRKVFAGGTEYSTLSFNIVER